jgi:RNA polymerase sigma-70 factor, ECF subfamily
MRPALCEDALRLGRILAELVPREPEAHGLVALMEIQASRMRARTGPRGEPILLLDQDRARWDRLLVQRGLAALERAVKLDRPLGPYALQVIELNRAVAVGMAFGPAAGLAVADMLQSEPALERYHLLPSVRGDLLAKLGRFLEAQRCERDLLLTRAAACAH